MSQKRAAGTGGGEKTIRDIRRATRRQYSAEEKIRIVLDGLRGEDSIAELCRREGINQNLYYRWSKEFLGAGTKLLVGDTAREATSEERPAQLHGVRGLGHRGPTRDTACRGRRDLFGGRFGEHENEVSLVEVGVAQLAAPGCRRALDQIDDPILQVTAQLGPRQVAVLGDIGQLFAPQRPQKQLPEGAVIGDLLIGVAGGQELAHRALDR